MERQRWECEDCGNRFLYEDSSGVMESLGIRICPECGGNSYLEPWYDELGGG